MTVQQLNVCHCFTVFHSESLLVFATYSSCYFDLLHLHHHPIHQDHDYNIHYDGYTYVSVNRWWYLLWSEITLAFIATTGTKMDVSWFTHIRAVTISKVID